MSKKFDKLGEKYPFLSLVSYAGSEYIGIIQNFDKNCLSIYDIDQIKDTKLTKAFLELGEQWWWESNRKIPINIFLKNEFTVFKPCLRTLIAKDCEVAKSLALVNVTAEDPSIPATTYIPFCNVVD